MDFALVVGIQPTALRLSPGDSAEVAVSIRNVSDVVEHYAVTIVGLGPPELGVVPPPLTKLLPGQSATVSLGLSLPATGGPPGGQRVLGVLVHSPQQPAVRRAEELRLDVESVAGSAMTIQPEVAYAAPRVATYGLTLRNDGNTTAHLQLSAADAEGRSQFRFDPAVVVLPPGATATASLRTEATPPWTGTERRRRVTVQAMAGAQVWGETAAEFVIKPRLAPGLVRTLGTVLAVGVLAVAILLGSVLGRDDPVPAADDGPIEATPTPTETAGASPSAEPSEGGGAGEGGGGGETPTPEVPQIAQISVDPASAQTGVEVGFAASVSGVVEEWRWRVLDSGGAQVVSSQEPIQFTHVFTTPGTFQVELSASGPSGLDKATHTLSVADADARFQLARLDVPANPGEVVSAAIECAPGRVAVGGGAVPEPAEGEVERPPSVLSVSGVVPPAERWRSTLRFQGTERGTVAVLGVCTPPPPGFEVVTTPGTVEAGSFLRSTATCQEGTVVLGGTVHAASSTGPAGPSGSSEPAAPLVVGESGPGTIGGGARSLWLTSVRNPGGQPVGVDLVAVCATEPAGYEVVRTDVPLVPGEAVEETVGCPTGKSAISGGATVTGEGTADFSTVIERTGPDLSGEQALISWQLGLRNASSSPHAMAVSAVCVPEQPSAGLATP